MEIVLEAVICAAIWLALLSLLAQLRSAQDEITEPARDIYDVPAYQRRAPRAPRGPVPQPPRERHLKERIRTQRERVSREQ